jgi:hypothetical protein
MNEFAACCKTLRSTRKYWLLIAVMHLQCIAKILNGLKSNTSEGMGAVNFKLGEQDKP